jgi:hypothetical protein
VPLEPLYSLEVACELIPVTEAALKHILSRRATEFGPPIYHDGGEPRYRNGHLVDYDGGAPHRMLTESDCLKVREIVTRVGFKRVEPKLAYGSNGRPPSDFGRSRGISAGPGLGRGKGRERQPSSIVMDLLMANDEVENVG